MAEVLQFPPRDRDLEQDKLELGLILDWLGQMNDEQRIPELVAHALLRFFLPDSVFGGPAA
jgi:hypothetical protein